MFNIDPDRIIFIDLVNEKDVLWTIEEALKCDAISAVVGELKEISFTESRRLQLATEQSGVTGLMNYYNRERISNTTSVARWEITSLASEPEHLMPGVGYPRWNVELLKIRNGKPGSWELEWVAGSFRHITRLVAAPEILIPQTG
jgi:protein ImuA